MHQKRHGGEHVSNLKPQKHNVEQKKQGKVGKKQQYDSV